MDDSTYDGWVGHGTIESARDTWKVALDLANNRDSYGEIKKLIKGKQRTVAPSKIMSIHFKYQKVDEDFLADTDLVNWQEVAEEINAEW